MNRWLRPSLAVALFALLATPRLAHAQATGGAEEDEMDAMQAVPPPAGSARAASTSRAPSDDAADDAGDDAGEGSAIAADETEVDGDATEGEPTTGEVGLEAEQAAMTDAEPSAVEEEEGEHLDHELQVGIRVGAGVPYFFGLRYGRGPPCGPTGETFCHFLGAGFVDIDLSFGVTPDLEITALGRIGMVGVSPTDQNPIVLGLGIRSYLSPSSMFKFFLGARLILDLTSAGTVTNWSDVDFGARGEVGVQLDIVRYFGLYLQIGVNIAFLRAFGIAADGSGGVQARFP